MKRTFPCVVLILAIVSLSACATVQATPVPPTPNGLVNAVSTPVPSALPTQKPTQEPLAALVNDQGITLAVLDREVNRQLDGIRSMGGAMPADARAFKLSVLDSLIEQVLIEQAAAIQNVTVTDAEVDAEVQENVRIAGNKDKWLTQLAADGMTEAEARAGLRSTLITQKMVKIVTKNIGSTAEQVHARHILVADEATANEIVNKLKAKADFAQLAAQYSLDVTTKQTGGDLGWFTRGQLLQKAVEDSAFSLDINQVSGPVKSDLGYHIVQTLEHVKDRPVDDQTRSRLVQEAFEQWIQGLRKSARIQIFVNG